MAKRLPILLSVLAMLVYLGAGIIFLERGHPHEDAFILFRYAENLAEGHGIVFNPGGPRTEGATDFLWLLMLAGLVKLGIDVAVGAVILNAVGAGLAVWILCRRILRSQLPTPWRIPLAFLSLGIN